MLRGSYDVQASLIFLDEAEIRRLCTYAFFACMVPKRQGRLVGSRHFRQPLNYDQPAGRL